VRAAHRHHLGRGADLGDGGVDVAVELVGRDALALRARGRPVVQDLEVEPVGGGQEEVLAVGADHGLEGRVLPRGAAGGLLGDVRARVAEREEDALMLEGRLARGAGALADQRIGDEAHEQGAEHKPGHQHGPPRRTARLARPLGGQALGPRVLVVRVVLDPRRRRPGALGHQVHRRRLVDDGHRVGVVLGGGRRGRRLWHRLRLGHRAEGPERRLPGRRGRVADRCRGDRRKRPARGPRPQGDRAQHAGPGDLVDALGLDALHGLVQLAHAPRGLLADGLAGGAEAVGVEDLGAAAVGDADLVQRGITPHADDLVGIGGVHRAVQPRCFHASPSSAAILLHQRPERPFRRDARIASCRAGSGS
jgi:hypothetical protein